MAFVESVVMLLLQKLGDHFLQEAISLRGVRDQVEWLEEEFTRMQSFLKDADSKQEGDERVKNWVRNVRDVAYDAEDVIDTFTFNIATFRQEGSVDCIRRYVFFFIELIALYKLGSEIERINNKIREISESRSTYGIKNIENIGQGAGTSFQERRLTSPDVQEPDFVGFEKDLNELVVRLTEGELRRCVISVVGMGGLGKTTLTKKVYNNTRVQTCFNSCEWISISEEYDARDLLQNILNRFKRLPEEDLKKMDLFQLRHEISNCLEGKRYLMVLDDIWTNEAWDDLRDAFPDMNNGSRVMLTTRHKYVALYADVRSPPYELRFLDKEESWELFFKKTFPGQDIGSPQDLEQLGREIVEKCHGLPLAIVVIGGLLSRKEPWEWENVRKNISWQFVEGEVKISPILSLSYTDLPYELKPCFLYLGNFPEDYEFQTEELIQLWAAEGLLQQRGQLTLEEVGEDYLMQLIQRSMVQVARRSSSRGIRSCRIHDLLRDLSISEAKEGMFLQVHHGNANAPAAPRARRLAIHHNDLSRYISLSSFTPHLRSVLIYTQGYWWLQTEQEQFLYRGFKLLRVLYLHGAQIKKLPTEIGELVHLRYLGCTKTDLGSLPSSIGNLSNLHTLFVESFSYSIELPSTIGKIQQLRHLQVKSANTSNNLSLTGSWGVIEGYPRLDRMSNLKTLLHVKAGKWMEGCLGKLSNLRKLGIHLVTGADAKVFYESIANLDSLESLSVATIPVILWLSVPPLSHLLKLSKLRVNGKLDQLPKSSDFPTKLTKLTLAWTYLKQDPLPTLEKLKNLRVLKLLFRSYDGMEMACSAQGFPRLEFLRLEWLFYLEEWRVEEGAMPNLLHLEIDSCHKLKKLPEGLDVTTLKKFELLNMNDFVNRHKSDWERF